MGCPQMYKPDSEFEITLMAELRNPPNGVFTSKKAVNDGDNFALARYGWSITGPVPKPVACTDLRSWSGLVPGEEVSWQCVRSFDTPPIPAYLSLK